MRIHFYEKEEHKFYILHPTLINTSAYKMIHNGSIFKFLNKAGKDIYIYLILKSDVRYIQGSNTEFCVFAKHSHPRGQTIKTLLPSLYALFKMSSTIS